MTSARAFLCAVLAVCSLLFCVPAHAEAIRVLFSAHEETPFSARVRAEIGAMGFELVASDTLDAAGHSTVKAAAYVIEAPPPRRVELWLQNASTGVLELSTVVEAPPLAGESEDAPETVKASEQLRAFFQPLAPPRTSEPETPSKNPKQSEPLPPPAPPLAATPTITHQGDNSRDSRTLEEFALVLPLDRGRLGLDAMLRGGTWLGSRLGIGGKLVIPVLDSKLTQDQNSASVSTALLGPELWLRLLSSPTVNASAHVGVSLAWLRATGEATAPYTSQTAQGFAALPSLGATISHHLAARWSITVGGEVGWAVPKFDVLFGAQKVATAGEPLGLTSLGATLDL